MDYPNVTRLMGAALSIGLSRRDLDEYLSIGDVLDALEVVAVDAHNARLIQKAMASQR